MPDQTSIESILKEARRFEPPRAKSLGMPRWHISSMDEYNKLYDQSINDPETFWSTIAAELQWFQPWTKVVEWTPPDAKWFIGAKTNLCYNCVDRHVEAGHGAATAIIW